MSRPHSADVTRERLLDAAAAAFAERGFDGARVDDIATRAGVNKALIYAYYRDKEGLYRAVLSSRLVSPTRTPGGASQSRATLEDVIRRHLRLVVEDRAFARLVAWDLLAPRRRGRDVLVESAEPALERLSELIREARTSGALRAGVDPQLFRDALVALALGYSLQRSAMNAHRRSGASSLDEAFVDYACRLLLESGPREEGSGGGGDPPR